VWAPIALRAAALVIALVGLAGIGAAVSQAPELAKPIVARAGFDFDGLSTRALVALAGTGGTPAVFAASNTAARADPARASGAERARASGTDPAPTSPADSPPSPRPPCSCPCAASRAGEGEPNASALSPSAPAPSEPRVALNRASAAELRRLPGVGAKRAEAILQLRQRLGRFRKPTDLLRVKGIGPRTLERMLPHLVLD
jgi:competence protein ComEA